MKALRVKVRMGLAPVLLGMVLVSAPEHARAADRFVSTLGNDTANNCLSSVSPCSTLSHATAQATSGDSVKVAGGSYSGVTINTATTLMLSGGWTADFSARDPLANPTIQESLIRVVAGPSVVSNITVDGFTFVRAALTGESTGDGSLTLAVNGCTFTGTGLNLTSAILFLSKDSSSVHLSVSDSRISRGRAGGIRVGCYDSSSLSATIARSTLDQNRDNGSPGAAGILAAGYCSSLDLKLTDSRLTKNKYAARDHSANSQEQGGILVGGGPPGTTSVAITNSVITRNWGAVGGGVTVEGNTSLMLTNATVTRNRTLHVLTYPTRVVGYGGGLLIRGNSTVTLVNTILWGNDSPRGADLFVESGGSPVVSADHSDIGEQEMTSGTFNDLGGNINVNPRFVNSWRDVHLTPLSPMIDAGTCTGAPTTDFEGDPRPSGAGCDMGADEFVP